MVVHAYDASTWETETGATQAKGQPELAERTKKKIVREKKKINSQLLSLYEKILFIEIRFGFNKVFKMFFFFPVQKL